MATKSVKSTPISPKSEMGETGSNMLFKRSPATSVENGRPTVLDSAWAKHSFLATSGGSSSAIGGVGKDGQGAGSRLFVSSADRKYTDTTMGGSIGVGARPQFTRYSDPRSKGSLAGREDAAVTEHSGNNGMGRLYSEAYDDPAEIVFMRFGVPQFNSLSQFFTEFADTEVTRLAVSGKSSTALYDLGKAVGTLTVLLAAPLLSASVFTLKTLYDWFQHRRTTRFYTLKPTMHLYWSTVNTLVNTLSVNRGLVPRPFIPGSGSTAPQASDSAVMNAYMPNLISSTGFVDVGAIANKAQRRSNHLNRHIGGNDTIRGDLGISNGEVVGISHNTTKMSFQKLVSVFSGVDKWYTTTESPKNGIKMQYKPNEVHELEQTAGKKQHALEGPRGLYQKIHDSLLAEFQQGSQWAIFRVDHGKSRTKTFTSSVKTNEIGDKFNAQSSNVRDVKFNFAGGNIGDSGVANALENTAGAASSLLRGAMSGLTFGLTDSIADLLAGVTMEMPKYWDAANAELSTADYSMTLISPYNNAWSHMQNIYIPLCMILAGALPLKSGAQSHVSPLLCSVFNKGKSQKMLGMITSVNIERGVTNMPFDIAGHALSISVSFSITDLAPCMSVPISAGGLFNGENANPLSFKNRQIDEDTAIFDFLATLAAMTIAEQGDGMVAAKVRFNRGFNAMEALTSPSAWALQGYEALLSNPITAIPTRLATALAKSNSVVTDDNRQDLPSIIG